MYQQWQNRATCSGMAAQVKVDEHGLGLLRPRQNAGPVCHAGAAESSICANVALYKVNFIFTFLPFIQTLEDGSNITRPTYLLHLSTLPEAIQQSRFESSRPRGLD